MDAKMSLSEIGLKHKCAKANYLGYLPIYERILSKYREEQITLFEIGVQYGASMKMWREWFNPKAKIIGIDTDENCIKYSEPEKNIFVIIANAIYKKQMDAIEETHGRYDIIIDDGGHGQRDQVSAFNILWGKLKPGGLYVVEDICCSYIDFFMQGLPAGETSRFIYKFCESMHHIKGQGYKEKNVSAIYTFPSIIFVEKYL